MCTKWLSIATFVAFALLLTVLTPPSNGSPIPSTTRPESSNQKYRIEFVGETHHKSTHLPMYIPKCETITNEANETKHEIEVKPFNSNDPWFPISKCVCAFNQPGCDGPGKTVVLNANNVILDDFRLKSVKLCRPDWQKRREEGKRICE